MINFGITERKKEELEQRMQKCNLFEKDIAEKFVRSSGSGGQKVNKSSTCVHLKHITSGLSVKIQKSRSQGLNRYYARKECVNCLRINCWEKKAQTQKGQKRFESRKTGIDAEPPHNKKQGMQTEVLYGWRTLGLGAVMLGKKRN